ncbi:MAG: GTPase Era [Gemmatimonadetes bacterium]|nr:GTPase Era [Gemmatimonadota bacterium]
MSAKDLNQNFRSGYIVLAGKPNVGKSTLFNALVGERLSIVSHKPQTTRNNIIGILTTDKSQLIFQDTPGLLEPQYRLHEAMLRSIGKAVGEADIVLGMVDASDFESSFSETLKRTLNATNLKRIVALNKIDLVGSDEVERFLAEINTSIDAHQMVAISAATGQNLDELQSILESALPFGPMYYPEDTLTEHPERFFVAELIREEIFSRLRQELPYAIAVKVEEFKEDRSKVYIRADIVVERNSQKGIVIGQGGKTLRNIGRNARMRIESFLERQVYLDLHVKVYENWRKKDSALRGFGYDVT